MRMLLLLYGAFSILVLLSPEAKSDQTLIRNAHQKNIIAFGGIPASSGGMPTPTDMVANRKLVESIPVDGIVFNLTNIDGFWGDYIMEKGHPAFEKLQPELDAYQSMNRGKGKNNHDFIRINTSRLTADWYDCAQWQRIIENIQFTARAMQIMGVRSIMLDTEAYHSTPFNYMMQIRRTEKDFKEYCTQVRKRGYQCGKAIAEFVEDPVVMLTFGPQSAHGQKQNGSIEQSYMGLVPAFVQGIAEGSDCTIIDGFEEAYNYHGYEQFKNAAKWMASPEARAFPGFNGKGGRFETGFGIWLNYNGYEYNLLDVNDFVRNSFTPLEWEYAISYALANAGSHIWLYSVPWCTLPDAYQKALIQARSKHQPDFKPIERAVAQKKTAYICSAKGRADTADSLVFAPLYRTHKELFDFPKEWQFRLDPNGAGLQEEWYKTNTADGWIRMRIDDWWEPQLNRNYFGAAWYRVEFTAPSEWNGKKLFLAFGAVDEDAYVFLNGQKIGEHAFGADGWNTPFEFEITDKLNFEKPNVLTVCVVNMGGVGGIWKSVKVFCR